MKSRRSCLRPRPRPSSPTRARLKRAWVLCAPFAGSRGFQRDLLEAYRPMGPGAGNGAIAPAQAVGFGERRPAGQADPGAAGAPVAPQREPGVRGRTALPEWYDSIVEGTCVEGHLYGSAPDSGLRVATEEKLVIRAERMCDRREAARKPSRRWAKRRPGDRCRRRNDAGQTRSADAGRRHGGQALHFPDTGPMDRGYPVRLPS